jgi:hypothetical protein
MFEQTRLGALLSALVASTTAFARDGLMSPALSFGIGRPTVGGRGLSAWTLRRTAASSPKGRSAAARPAPPPILSGNYTRNASGRSSRMMPV